MDFMLIQSYLNKVPKLDDILILPEIKKCIAKYGKKTIEEKIEAILDKRHLEITTAKKEEDVKKIDFSMHYYIEVLEEELKEEKSQGVLKVINCLGTVYTDLLGSKIYSRELLKEFSETYKSYNSMKYDLKNSKEISISEEISELLKSYWSDSEYLLFSNFSGAIFTIINSCYKGLNLISSVRESYNIDKGVNLNSLLDSLGTSKKIVGSLNKITIDDYNKNYDENSFIVLSDFYGNNLDGLAKLENTEVEELLKKERTVFFSNRFYLNTTNKELVSNSLELKKFLNNKSLVLADLSKTEDVPGCILVAGPQNLIKTMKESIYSKMFSPSEEVEMLFYLGVKAKLEENKDHSYLNKVLSTSESKLKNRNLNFIKNIEKELEETCDIGLLEGPYLKIEEEVSYKDAYSRELVVITPKGKISAEEIEIKLRNSNPSVLCWRNEGNILINLQLVDDRDAKILRETLINSILK